MKLAIVLLCVIAHATLVLGNPDDMGPGDSPVESDPSGEAFKSGVTTSMIEEAETDEGLDEIGDLSKTLSPYENGGDEGKEIETGGGDESLRACDLLWVRPFRTKPSCSLESMHRLPHCSGSLLGL